MTASLGQTVDVELQLPGLFCRAGGLVTQLMPDWERRPVIGPDGQPILVKLAMESDAWRCAEAQHLAERLPAELAHEAEQQRLAGQRKSLERQGQGLLF